MKRLFLFFLCLLVFIIPSSAPAVSADGILSASSSQIIRVGIYENEPRIFTDDEGNVSEFWPEITDYIADRENWKIE